jgi:predicted small secreted protein
MNTNNTNYQAALKIALLATTLIVGVALMSCNTVAGAGQDVEQLGEGIEATARDAQN